jgi:dolichol kinase
MIAAMVVVAGGGLAIDLARFNLGWLNRHYMRWLAPLLKGDESAHITGATYMVVAGLLLFLLYGKDVAVPAMLFLSLGDPAAAVVGSRLRGPRFRGKSPGGTLAFIAVGAAATGVVVAAGGVDHHWALWVGAVVAGLVELASIPPDDNFTIPILAGTAMYLMGA